MSMKHPTQGDESQAAHGDVYRIAEEVVERSEDGHMRRCENDPAGPVCKVLERIGEVEKRVGAIEDGRAQERGAAEAMARSNVRTVQLLAALSALSTIVGFVLSHWPRR